jgi:hypothetical protein
MVTFERTDQGRGSTEGHHGDKSGNITFERTEDLVLVRALIAGDARVYDAATDDAAPERAAFAPVEHPAIWYVVASDADQLVGLYTLIPQNQVCWEIHATRTFGTATSAAARGIQRWIFDRTECRRIVASIPATNRVAIRQAKACGFVEFGRNQRSFLKNGELIDQVLLGVSA